MEPNKPTSPPNTADVSSTSNSSTSGTTGTAGTNPSGVAGTNPSGAAGTNPSGTTGTNPSGVAGTNPSGAAGTNPSGTTGTNPSGPTPLESALLGNFNFSEMMRQALSGSAIISTTTPTSIAAALTGSAGVRDIPLPPLGQSGAPVLTNLPEEHQETDTPMEGVGTTENNSMASMMQMFNQMMPGLMEHRSHPEGPSMGETMGRLFENLPLIVEEVQNSTVGTPSTSTSAVPTGTTSSVRGEANNPMAPSNITPLTPMGNLTTTTSAVGLMLVGAAGVNSAPEDQTTTLLQRIRQGDHAAVEEYKADRRRRFEVELEAEIRILINPRITSTLEGIFAGLRPPTSGAPKGSLPSENPD
jgi:hypothetical protein